MLDENVSIEFTYVPIKDITGNIDKKRKLFGRKFVENNKYKCKIIYRQCDYELVEYFVQIDYTYNRNALFKKKLNGINNIADMSYMFSECISIPSEISKLDTSNVINIKYMFNEAFPSSLPDISNWDTSEVHTMEGMLCHCENL